MSGPHPPDEPAVRDELAGLDASGRVLGALADAVATPPPPALRARLLAAAGGRPRPSVAPLPAAFVHRARVEAFAALLDDLAPADWHRPVGPYPWSVHELVAHVALVEELTARQLGLTGEPPVPLGDPTTADHVAFGATARAEAAAGDPADTVARWRRAARQVVAHTTGEAFDPHAPVPLHGWPFDATDALVVRAFELWTHDEDVRRATGRPLDPPSPGEVRTMSSASVRALPLLAAGRVRGPFPATRVVLTGAGGGTFDLGAPADATTRHLLVADVVDYCRVVARRLDPAALAGTREGDLGFLDALLDAARSIAV